MGSHYCIILLRSDSTDVSETKRLKESQLDNFSVLFTIKNTQTCEY